MFASTKKTEWSLTVYKQLEVVGSMMHGVEDINGKTVDTMELALELMEKNTDRFSNLVTHYYPIDEYKDAFNCAWNKGKEKAIKVAFDFR